MQGGVLLGLFRAVGPSWNQLVSLYSGCGLIIKGCVLMNRYNCNRYNESDAKVARDSQQVQAHLHMYLPNEMFEVFIYRTRELHWNDICFIVIVT